MRTFYKRATHNANPTCAESKLALQYTSTSLSRGILVLCAST